MLEDLSLQNNQLTGPVPAWLQELTHLRTVDFASNQLTGPIPPELGNLVALEYLQLDDNQLSGVIPASLGGLGNLIGLRLSHNQLTGPIPAELGDLSSLVFLHLWDNHLAGVIPPTLGQLANLEELFLSQNRLTGAIQELGSLAMLRAFHVAGNQLVGALPSSLATSRRSPTAGASIYGGTGCGPPPRACRDFCTLKGGNWSGSQTVAPTGVQVSAATDRTVKVSWTRIAFTEGSGGYRVLYSLAPGGPFTLAGTTQGKLTTDLIVTGLVPGSTYHFVVETRTEPHDFNQNAVVSAQRRQPGHDRPASVRHPAGYRQAERSRTAPRGDPV